MVDPDAPVLLVGYRATGKTTVAKLLAGRIGFDWIDADDEIERRAEKTIAEIFADEGEQGFRDREAIVVADLTGRRRAVIALGGGAVLREENRRVIQTAGTVVWLTASIATIFERLAADDRTWSRRPNLTKAGGRSEIESLLAERTPIYRACATFEVDTEGKTPAGIVDEIIARL